MFYAKKFCRGFTLIEILIAIGILAVLFVFISAPLQTFYRKIVFQGAVENTLTMLDEARKSTLSSLNSSQYGVHFSSTTVTLFAGDTYTSGNPDNDVYELDTRVEITNISLNGGGNSTVFERITGETTDYGTVVLTEKGGALSSSTITIHPSGLVEGYD